MGLVSGGKDSCFNILKCQSLGHDLVALANLYPQGETDEIDSFMYQTVGYQAVSLFDQLFGVPLYRQCISGSSSHTLEYEVRAEDETEDLYQLLKTVVENHPDVKGVSVGAILSTYQRVRVENVCGRLGLVSLAYLWQMPQKQLFYEIINSGMYVRLIKTAGIGLSKRHLGKSLKELEPELVKLNQMYDLHLCGEGGEYETLVLDGPHFKKRLEIEEMAVVDHSNDDVSYLSLKARVVDKEMESVDLKEYVEEQPLLNETFHQIYEKIKDVQCTPLTDGCVIPTSHLVKPGQHASRDTLFLYNMTGGGSTAADQVKTIFNALYTTLSSQGLTLEHITFASLVVADMDTFGPANEVYKTYFPRPLPPARVCIAANLPSGCLAQMSVIVRKAISSLLSLHVQSQSYWAPANIGPYSQAKTCEGITYLAGQIGLVPSTMLLARHVPTQVCLSLQNIHNIMDVMKISKLATCICYITDSSTVPFVLQAWEELHAQQMAIRRPLIVAEVNQLPREAAVEWAGFGWNQLQEHYDDDSNTEATVELIEDNFYLLEYGNNKVFWTADTVEPIPLSRVVFATILSTGRMPEDLEGETIYVKSLYYGERRVDYATITWCERK